MNKFFIVLITCFSLSSFSQITVPETKKAFFGIVEATWCGVCGQYGIPATTDIITQSTPKAIYVGLHKSLTSELFSQTGSDLATAFGTAGQPIFTVNGQDLGAYSGVSVNFSVTAINNFYSATGADVNAGFEYGIVGDTIYAHTRTTFFNALSGEYYVGVYLYEDAITAWQANYDPGIADMDIVHNNILRTSLNGSFGAEIAAGTISAGTSFNRNFKMKLDPAWNTSELHVFTIVWKKNGTEYDFVNANDVGTVITGYVGIDEDLTSSISIYPNPTTDYFKVNGIEEENLEVSIFDLTGKQVAYFYHSNQINIGHLPKGVYLVQVDINGSRIFRKVVKE